MASNADISLPSVRNAKDYVLKRTQAEIALADAIDAILERYIGLITRVCYKYDIDTKDFTFAANEQMRQEVYALLDELYEEIYALIEDYAVPDGRKNKHWQTLISWMVTLGTHGWNFRTTLRYYISRFASDIEAMIAAMRYAGLNVNASISRMRSALHSPYSMAEMIAAIRSGTFFSADMIRSGGTKTDPFTHRPTMGLSKIGATNITTMARSTLSMVFMRDLLLTAQDEGKAGYYVYRGSSYPCQACDDETARFHPIEEGMVLPVHAFCRCYVVFVDGEDDRPRQYRNLNFY